MTDQTVMNRFRTVQKTVGFGRLFLLLLFAIVYCNTSQAESELLLRIRREAKNLKSLQAEFVQYKQMKILMRPLISKGRFFFKAPASLRWEYLSPVSSVVLMHRGQVSRFFKKDGKVIRDSGSNLQATQVIMQNITSWLGGRFDENPFFKMTMEKNRIILKPSKPMPGMMDRVELLLSNQPGIIEAIFIFEDNENYTKIQLKVLEINKPIADSVFQGIS